MVILDLKKWKERKGVTNVDIIQTLIQKTSVIKDARLLPFSRPTIQGFGISGGFTFELQNLEGRPIDEFNKTAQDFLAALNQRPEIMTAYTTFNPGFPQYLLSVNVPKVKQAGLTVSGIMQGFFGGIYVSNYNQFGKQYRIMVQSDAEYRTSPETLNGIMVRTSNGNMAPVTEFINLTKVYGPERLTRFNMYLSISVNGNPNKGFGSGDAMKAISEVAAETLPAGFTYEYSGVSREEQKASSQTIYIFILSLLFVYFLLSALYESYFLPLAVLLSLPIGLAGIFIFDTIFGIDNNIYTQISMIMLIGLLAKNAILIVEYASTRREKGMSIIDSATDGAKVRLRPILMTSFAFIIGIMPLIFSTGAGASGNKSIGFSAVGGMFFGTLLGVLVIPSLFIIFQTLQEKLTKKKVVERNTND
jgi:HAE1 family hydrophobic/amphiphilic exporter-1